MSPAEDDEEEEAAEAVDMIPCGTRGARESCRPDTPGETRAHPPPDRFSAWSHGDPWRGRGSGHSRNPTPAPLRFPPPGPAHYISGSGLKSETGGGP